MASIKDALEESVQDNLAIIKYVIFTVPLFYLITLLSNGSKNNSGLIIFVAIFTVSLLFGILLSSTRNVRTGKSFVLPSFNIFGILWTGIKGIIVLSPLIGIGYFLGNFICGFLPNLPLPGNLVLIFKWIIYAICASFPLTGFVLYSQRFKVLDTYNFNHISKYCIDILIEIFFMLIKLAFVDLLLLSPVTYLIWLFMGIPNPVAIFYWSMVLVLNIVMIGHYFAQLDYEKVEENREII